jgi:adenylate cyclase
MTDCGAQRLWFALLLTTKYAASLIYAHLSAAIAVALAIRSFRDHAAGAARQLATVTNFPLLGILVAAAAAIGVFAGARFTYPVFRWFAQGAEPDPAQQRAAVRISNRQAVITFFLWLGCGVGFWLFNTQLGKGMLLVLAATVTMGAAMAASMGWLLAQRVMRPVIAAALRVSAGDIAAPGVRLRMGVTWALFTAVPTAAIMLLVLARLYGWFPAEGTSIEAPVLVLAVMVLMFSCRAMILVADSIADPVRDVLAAMKQVGQGNTAVRVAVYEPSEVGHLQSGFNDMVAGLAERKRLRDLFGQYVGSDVAQRALAEQTPLSGEVCDAAVLFVDLVGSTALAAQNEPQRTAQILNAFFQCVVAAVESQQGLINKFEGDAVLAVFGAPLRLPDAAAAALLTARRLAADLNTLSAFDFGVGVSYGSVFAGTVGAEHRYEYTVIGDAVNEAARLADEAKHRPARILCSDTALTNADDAEQLRWHLQGSIALRGRAAPTAVAEPC